MAAIVLVASEIQDMADCLICCQKFYRTARAPIVLSCGHTFCRECVAKVTVSHVCKCFECRAANVFPDNDPIVNVSVIRVLETLHLLAKDDTATVSNNVETKKVESTETQLFDRISTQLIEHVVRNGDDYRAVDAANGVLVRVQTALNEYTKTIYDGLVDNDEYSDDDDHSNNFDDIDTNTFADHDMENDNADHFDNDDGTVLHFSEWDLDTPDAREFRSLYNIDEFDAPE